MFGRASRGPKYFFSGARNIFPRGAEIFFDPGRKYFFSLGRNIFSYFLFAGGLLARIDWTLPLRPSVEFPPGPRFERGVRRYLRGTPCGPCRWGLLWSSLWGHEAREDCAGMVAGTPCNHCSWSRRWNSFRGNGTCGGCTDIGVGTSCGPCQ